MTGTPTKTTTYRIEITLPDRVAFFDHINTWNISDDLLIMNKGKVTTVIPMRNVGRIVCEAV